MQGSFTYYLWISWTSIDKLTPVQDENFAQFRQLGQIAIPTTIRASFSKENVQSSHPFGDR